MEKDFVPRKMVLVVAGFMSVPLQSALDGTFLRKRERCNTCQILYFHCILQNASNHIYCFTLYVAGKMYVRVWFFPLLGLER